MRSLRLIMLVMVLVLASTVVFAQEITHGPAVGGVTDNSARMTVRVGEVENTEILFELSVDEGDFSNAITSSTVNTSSDNDYFVTVDVEGLNSNTVYYYRINIDGTAGDVIGHFQTFPQPGEVVSFSFGHGSCQQADGDTNSFGGEIWPVVLDHGPKFFIQTGDWGYPDIYFENRNPWPPYFHEDMQRVRDSYKVKYDNDYPMVDVLRSMPVDYIYDDHDYTHNNSDGSYANKLNSVNGYNDLFPHYPLADGDNALYHSFVYGNCEFFVVDNRTERDPNINAFPNIMEWLQDPENTLLYYAPTETHLLHSQTQMEWLIDGLTNSTATWKFIVSTMPFNPGHRAGLELALALQGHPDYDPIITPSGMFSPAEIAIEFSDGWGGFPASRQALINAVAENNVENVILLSGDSHTACIDDGSFSMFPEHMAGGVDRTNAQIVLLQETFGIFTWDGLGQHLGTLNFDEHFGFVEVNGDESVTLHLIDTQDNSLGELTIEEGFTVERVNLTAAPQGWQYNTPVGEMTTIPMMIINTSIDDLIIQDLIGLDQPYSWMGLTQEFMPDPTFSLPATVAPGHKQILGITFAPQEEGIFLDTLAIASNDPDGVLGALFFGTTEVNDVKENINEVERPSYATLHPNVPNPFNPETTIRFDLEIQSDVQLTVHNALGREVAKLIDDSRNAGQYSVVFDGSEYASGMYFVRLKTQSDVQIQKMMLLK